MKDLVKNPIGIIALFISLIYGFANLLLGTTAKALTPEERYPIVIFIVLFPVVVLGIFYMLVSRHHGKLYAPGDYKDDKSFLRTLSQEERDKKLETEAQEALPEAMPVLTQSEGQPQDDRPSTADRMAAVRNELRAIESEVVERFESEFGVRAERDVAVGETGANFDALFTTSSKLTFLEVKSIRHSTSVSIFLDRVLYNAVVADKFLNSNFKLVLAIVYHFDKQELPNFEAMIRRKVERCPASIELRFISRSDLKSLGSN